MKVLSLLQQLTHRLPRRARIPVLTAIAGLGAGLAAVMFQLAMSGVYRAGIVQFSKQQPVTFAVASFAIIVGTSLISGWLLTSFCPEAAGSGIPQLKAAMWKDFGFVKIRVIWVKFVAGVLQIGGGSSMGREGPAVQLAGAVGSNLTGVMGEPKQRRRLGAATGAAAGLAAAFNTPLAAVTFVLEELIGDLNSRLLGSVLLAAVLGALVTHGIIGAQPAFTLAPVGESTWRAYLLIPLVAAVASLMGVIFQKLTMKLRQNSRKWERIPAWVRPAIGGMLCWALGMAVFQYTGRIGVFGLGYDDLSDALAGNVLWKTAAILLVAKLLATVVCYGTGGCGGIFSPTLFFGAMAGVATAGGIAQLFPMPHNDLVMLSVVGMSATLGAVVGAPVTSILIVFEMTHQFAILPPLMLGTLVSQAVSRSLARHNFYDELLTQDGHDVERLKPLDNLRAWQEQPVKSLANPRPVVITSLEAKEIRRVLTASPYSRFPLVVNGHVAGIVSREEAEAAAREERAPHLHQAHLMGPETPVRDAQIELISSESGMVLLEGEAPGQVGGLITIHDLLRAQQAAAESPD
ncbi:MAG TPA: chloride channel protein [Dongiaceae bacterium]|nr:chloride channel protein [Dongiaceae bacterium]